MATYMPPTLGVKANGVDDVPRPFIIGVGGGTASGKSSVCTKITEQLDKSLLEQAKKRVAIIRMENFYKEPLDKDIVDEGSYNFDHPNNIDEVLMIGVVKNLISGKHVQVPVYDMVTHTRKPQSQWETVSPADVILIEGILVFYSEEMRNLFHIKLFVDTEPDIRLARRVLRDVVELGRELDQTLQQYTTFVKPAFEEFCLPTKKYADVIIPRGADNTVAIDVIVQHILEILKPTKPGSTRSRPRHNSDSVVSPSFNTKLTQTPH